MGLGGVVVLLGREPHSRPQCHTDRVAPLASGRIDLCRACGPFKPLYPVGDILPSRWSGWAMRKRVATEQTPVQILEAATRVFGRHGYAAVSVDELTDEIGLTKGSVYHYFRSKADVLLSATVATLESFRDEIAQRADELTGVTPEARLLELLEKHNELTAKRHEAFIFLVRTRRAVEEAASAPQRRELRALHAAYEAPFVEAIRHGIGAGVFRAVDPVVTARFVLGACNWMAQWHAPNVPPAHSGASSWEEQLVDVVLRGLVDPTADAGRRRARVMQGPKAKRRIAPDE